MLPTMVDRNSGLGRVLINPFCKSLADVRFAPKATELLRGSEMTRSANNGHGDRRSALVAFLEILIGKRLEPDTR